MTEGSVENESLTPFLLELKNRFHILEIKENLRATPRGLFVAEKFVGSVTKAYQAWLETQTAGEIHKSEEKARKRLFGSLEPEGYYLIEGKNSLSGFLIINETRDPQKLGLPFYLGSLSSRKSYLHPDDPLVKDLKEVDIISEASGATVKVKLGNRIYTAGPDSLGYFVNVAKNSHKTLQEFPELLESLGVQCRAFAMLFRKSKSISPEKLLLIPDHYKETSKYEFRLLGTMVFVLDKKGSLISVYGLRGKDIYRFIRREFSLIRNKHLGSFEIYSDRHKQLGQFRYTEKHYQLSTQALIDFILEMANSPDKRDKLSGSLTVKKIFERFSEIFQTAQPIQKHLVKNYIAKYGKHVSECRINGVWLFFITNEAVIEATIPKF